MSTTTDTTSRALDVDVSAGVACECMLLDLEIGAHPPEACPRTARWVIRSTCCTQTILLCDDCLTAEQQTVADIVARRVAYEYQCRTCGGPIAAGVARRLRAPGGRRTGLPCVDGQRQALSWCGHHSGSGTCSTPHQQNQRKDHHE